MKRLLRKILGCGCVLLVLAAGFAGGVWVWFTHRPLRARTTSQFLTEFRAQVAVNGDFFLPWWSKTPWDYYPCAGDPVELEGFAASRGVVYSTHPIKDAFPRLYISMDDRILIGMPPVKPYNVLSGNPILLRDGKNLPAQKPPFASTQERRPPDGKGIIRMVSRQSGVKQERGERQL